MRDTAEKIAWLITGAAVGVGATFLFGTREGEKFRRKVGRRMEEGCEQVGETGRELINKGKEILDEGLEIVEESGRRVGARLHVAGK